MVHIKLFSCFFSHSLPDFDAFGIFDSTLFIGFRHSSLNSQRRKKRYERLRSVILAYKLQCIDSRQ